MVGQRGPESAEQVGGGEAGLSPALGKGRRGPRHRHDAGDLVLHCEAGHADAHLQGHRGGARADRQLLSRVLPQCLWFCHGEHKMPDSFN